MYISTARYREPSVEAVEDILRISRRNNQRDGLTGLLIVGGRRFLQVLEGPRAACDEAYTRIREDARHFALVELGRKPIEGRSFPEWSMGFEDMASPGLVEQVERLTEQVGDPSLRSHLMSFAEIHRRAA